MKKGQTQNSESIQEQINNNQFNQNDIVWAKIIGYPWWPGEIKFTSKSKSFSLITESQKLKIKNEQLYYIQFFGDPSHAYVKSSKILKYWQHRQQLIIAGLRHLKVNQKLFKRSVKQADDMLCQQRIEQNHQIYQRQILEKIQTPTEKQIIYQIDFDINFCASQCFEIKKPEQIFSQDQIKKQVNKYTQKHKRVSKIQDKKSIKNKIVRTKLKHVKQGSKLKKLQLRQLQSNELVFKKSASLLLKMFKEKNSVFKIPTIDLKILTLKILKSISLPSQTQDKSQFMILIQKLKGQSIQQIISEYCAYQYLMQPLGLIKQQPKIQKKQNQTQNFYFVNEFGKLTFENDELTKIELEINIQ